MCFYHPYFWHRLHMPQLLGLIFDLDGTLMDSAGDLRRAMNALLASHKRRALSLDEIKSMVGDGMLILLRRAFAATGAALSEVAETNAMRDFVIAYQNQEATKEMLYPYVEETLAGFRAKKIKIGLCTNKLYLPTIKLLHDVGIADLFDFVAGSDTFTVFKPHPGHVLGVAAGLKVPPQNCIMIGDSSNDIRAAQAANVVSIAVSHGYGRDVEDLGADAVIDGFTELPKILGTLGFDIVG